MPAAPSPAAFGPPLSFGACGPLAVKTKPYRAENGGRVVAGAPARTIPRFPVLTADPPLIAAWLVGCMRNP